MKLLEFKKINLNNTYDETFNDGFAWSRVYEYPLVLELLEKYFPNNKNINIHNSSWGFGGVHITFKNKLDSLYNNILHTDILKSDLPKTSVYNITEPPTEDLINKFDVVINVSTLEEVNFDHLKTFDNLFSQLKDGGLLIATFDLPGLQIDKFENLFNEKILSSEIDLNGKNSKLINENWSHLNCGYMVVKK